MVILFIAGFIVQWIYFKDETEEEKKDKEHFGGEDIPLNKKTA